MSTIQVSSNGQKGGITSGITSNTTNQNINTCIWKGRKEGFFFTLGLAVIVEIIIRIVM